VYSSSLLDIFFLFFPLDLSLCLTLPPSLSLPSLF
jgi:hypothetical protein